MRVVAGDGLVREEARARHERAVAAAVAASEELVAAAHGEQRDAARVRRADRLALRGEVGCDERLLAILAAADVEEVVRARVERVTEPDRPHVELVAAKRRPPRRGRRCSRDRRRC